jgi:hypothetical protein
VCHSPIAVLGTTHVAVLEPTACRALRDRVEWWIVLHIVQLPLFGLLALAVFALTDGLRGPLVTTSRIGLSVFAIFYTATDAVLGIARGLLVRYARDLSSDAQAVMEAATESLGNGLVVDGLVGLGAVVFGISHSPPIGPAGLLIF